MDIVSTPSFDTSEIQPVEAPQVSYSVEFFHIYTDEKITRVHEASLVYLNELRKAWKIQHELVLLIDDYNPTNHLLTANDVLNYLKKQSALPPFWAYESAMVENAKLLLSSLTSAKKKKNYERYISQRNKYPCSLLTAAWYLTRLGMLPHHGIINSTNKGTFTPPSRLINILPEDYKSVELRARDIIKHSPYSPQLDNIQNLFFPMKSGRDVSLW